MSINWDKMIAEIKLLDEQDEIKNDREQKKKELTERLLDVVEQILYTAYSDDNCLPPHPTYVIKGDLICELNEVFTSFVKIEE
ncbi:MAG: hypothetical protein F6K31_36245 [Symploca sp. SIO2G7]|nr:hypothetical protein [Symploca sp. SIO2G7]